MSDLINRLKAMVRDARFTTDAETCSDAIVHIRELEFMLERARKLPGYDIEIDGDSVFFVPGSHWIDADDLAEVIGWKPQIATNDLPRP